MLLPFSSGLVRTGKADAECAALADRHYSRRKHGSRQFIPPGETLVLRDSGGTCVFGWHRALVERADDQEGVCCSIFRNESQRLSSEIILEAEQFAVEKWGPIRGFTYVNKRKVRSANPGYCFIAAGWKVIGKSKGGLRLLEKFLAPAGKKG